MRMLLHGASPGGLALPANAQRPDRQRWSQPPQRIHGGQFDSPFGEPWQFPRDPVQHRAVLDEHEDSRRRQCQGQAIEIGDVLEMHRRPNPFVRAAQRETLGDDALALGMAAHGHCGGRRRAQRADRLRLAGDGPVAYFEFPFDGGFTAGPLLFPGSPLILDASWSRVSGFCGSLTVAPGVLVPDPGGCTAGPLLLPGLPAMPAPESWALGVVISAGFFAGLVCAQAGSAVTTTTATAAPKSLVMVYSWKTESVGPAAPCHGRSARPGNVAAEA